MQSYEASHACCPARACQQRQRPKSASRRAHGRDVRAERANRAGPGGERRAPERRLVPVSSLMNMQPNSKIEGISRAISSGKLSPEKSAAHRQSLRRSRRAPAARRPGGTPDPTTQRSKPAASAVPIHSAADRTQDAAGSACAGSRMPARIEAALAPWMPRWRK